MTDTTVDEAGRDLVIGLDDESALDVGFSGGKAANLAKAAVAGIPTLPGTVLTTAFSEAVDAGAPVHSHPAVRAAFARAGGARRPLVARSSSVVEDARSSSMAGQFASVVGIEGLEAFAAAVEVVLASRERAGAVDDPIAVLVQPLVAPAVGGVMFGLDPVTGRTDRRLITAVPGAPEALVSGEVDGSRYLVDVDGRVVERDLEDGAELAPRDLVRLVRLSDRVAEVFGGPQDVEWAIAEDGDLWLLQSRPVTSEVRGVPRGPVYGPGPVAETFPEPLTELELDLWAVPLREAVEHAVRLAGSATADEVATSEVIVAVGGHVAIDLRLAGEIPPRPAGPRWLSPISALRRISVAWRIGRLRAALPDLAQDLLEQVDADLEAVPALHHLTSRQLVGLIHRTRSALRALHGHEILAGVLLDAGASHTTGASLALRILAEARRDGLSDEDIILRSPAVLALTAPRVGARPTLPPGPTMVDGGPVERRPRGDDDDLLREALRLRIRWVQELSGRAAWALGERLTVTGGLDDPEHIRHLGIDHLDAVATNRAMTVPTLVSAHPHHVGEPLPARFQLSDLGLPIRVEHGVQGGGGTGAGGGTGSGIVTHDTEAPPPGAILVTTSLTPGLGPHLGQLAGLVAETGSVLSHLAILAREFGVATVVGYVGATDELADGDRVTVDGGTGQVTVDRRAAAP